MVQGVIDESNNGRTTFIPKPARLHAPAGPQGTKVYEAADLAQMTSRLVELRKAEVHQPSLLGVGLPFTGQRFPLKAGINTVGRSTDNDIVLSDPRVSSLHAKIIHLNGNWRVLNLLSTNGTYVNGKKLTISPLKPGDRVRFAQAEFLFDYDDNPLPAANSKRAAITQIFLSRRFFGWLILGITLSVMLAVLFALIWW